MRKVQQGQSFKEERFTMPEAFLSPSLPVISNVSEPSAPQPSTSQSDYPPAAPSPSPIPSPFQRTSKKKLRNSNNMGVTSSLSADAAEFVPLSGGPTSVQAPPAVVSVPSCTTQPKWSGGKAVEITQVPRYLTSCYPFVSPDAVARPDVPGYPRQYYPGNLPPSLPLPAAPPIRFPAWQAVRHGYVGPYQPTTYGSMPFDPVTSALPVDVTKVRGDGLLPTPTQVGLTSMPPLPGQELLLTQPPDPMTSWVMTNPPPPVYLSQQQHQQQHLHHHHQQYSPQHQQQQQQQQHQIASLTNVTTYVTAGPSAAAQSPGSNTKVNVSSATKKETGVDARPPSPVCISRPSQTDLPAAIHNLTLKDKPHPLYVNHDEHSQSRGTSTKSNSETNSPEWKGEDQDSDSGYNSPMHRPNLVSNGIQVFPSQVCGRANKMSEQTFASPASSASGRAAVHDGYAGRTGNSGHASGTLTVSHVGSKDSDVKDRGKQMGSNENSSKSKSGNLTTELSDADVKKKRRRKKDQKDATRSPRSLGSNAKLMSRSSSSISSAGTKPEDDDEKIDLHSWTDFPPMSTKVVPPNPSSKPSLKSPLTSEERVPLKIQRSAHEPPWSIKFSDAGDVGSGRSRSSSGDKDKNLASNLITPPESAWGKIGRSFRSSQGPGLEEELSSMMSRSDTVPLRPTAAKDGVAGGAASSHQAVTAETSRPTSSSVQPSKSSVGPYPKDQNSEKGSHARFSQKGRPNTDKARLPGGNSRASLHNVDGKTSPNYWATRVAQPQSTSTNLPTAFSTVSSNHSVMTATTTTTTTACVATITGSAGTPLHTGLLPPPSSYVGHPNGSGVPRPHTAVPTVNCSIPPPPVPVRGCAPTQTPIRSYANITQGAIPHHAPPPPSTMPNPMMRGAVTQAGFQQMVPGFYSNNPSHPPFIPPASYPCFAGSPALQPPLTSVGGVVFPNSSYLSGISPSSSPMLPSQTTQQNSSKSYANSLTSGSNRQVGGSGVRPQAPPSTTPTSSDNRSNSKIAKTVQSSQSFKQPIAPDVAANSSTLETNVNVEGDETKKRRRRRRTRGRSKRGRDGENGEEGSEGSQGLERAISSSNVSESTLHFEDVDEFPDLLTSTSRVGGEDGGFERSTLSGASITYSDIIKSSWSKAGSQSRTQSLTGSCVSGDNDEEDNTSNYTGTTNESKRARKRRKRREQANKAAEAELAEISLEQQWLKEVGLKKSANLRSGETGMGGASGGKVAGGIITDSTVVGEAKRQTANKGGGKKSQQPIAFDIAAMIDAIQKKPASPSAPSMNNQQHSSSGGGSGSGTKTSKKEKVGAASTVNTSALPGNVLDSSAPVQKRGKEREVGKAKKPSPLKKVILKEREEKKRMRLLDEDPDSGTALPDVRGSAGVGIVGGESELSQDALSSKSEGTDRGDGTGAAELSADLSPISQTSPISMSPASPGNSGVNSPVTGSIGRDPVVMKIHSRRFREYCTQILDKEIDQCCTSLLQDLVRFQDRMYHKDPVKAKAKRRVVLGLREVTKHLKLKKIKCVVISPNLEKIQSKGGLDEALNNILNMCREQDVPFVFALGRRALGRACAKLVPVSVVGIFNYEGCESKYKSLISLTEAARTAYNEMVLAVEKEVAEYPTMASQTSSIGGVPGLFAAHMGHSRTPSGCSAISFTSSILSEPISENFPHAEPEVDSKGYEIVRDAAGNVVHPSGGKGKSRGGVANDIDDGNEADTEDIGEPKKRRGGRNLNSVRFGDVPGGGGNESKDSKKDVNAEREDDADDRSSLGRLSRNVSESTLINDDNFILKGEPYAVKHKGGLEDLDDEEEDEDFENDDGNGGIPKDTEEQKNMGPVPHIDSIHSTNYDLSHEILSHTSTLSHDPSGHGHDVASEGHPLLPTSAELGSFGDERDQKEEEEEEESFDEYDGEEDDDENDDVDEAEGGDEDEEEDVDSRQRHHRVIDKERIKNWLESQTNIPADD